MLPLEKMAEASEALELQRFDAVLVPENTPAEELAAFASNLRQHGKGSPGREPHLHPICSNTVTETEHSGPIATRAGISTRSFRNDFESSAVRRNS